LVGFDGAFLAQIDEHGHWNQVAIDEHLRLL
jgi:hypothetical protein